MGRELFGTDGVRGLVGQYPIDDTGAKTIGLAVGRYFGQPGQQVVVGRDPRESSVQLTAQLITGLTAAGVDAMSVGVLPTPGLAYLTRENNNFAAGIMVTASHNPYQYNGFKVFDSGGNKLDDATEAKLNQLIVDQLPTKDRSQQLEDVGLVKAYEDFLVSSANDLDLDGLTLAIDTANGAASGLAERVFTRLGANVTALFDQPDGRNINDGCGATDTKALQTAVTDNRLALGIALDGDADRVALIDGQGREVKGDHMMYILAVNGSLPGIVATVMSNLGFERSLKKQGIQLERTKVGDRYVLEGLRRTGFRLGGEQSGHIIFPDILATGDGLLAAVQTLAAISTSGKSLAQWYDEVELLPQALVNIPLDDKSRLELPEVKAFITAQTEQLGSNGRLLIRPSGTEPLARIMVEAADANQIAKQIADELQAILNSQGNEV